MYLSIFKGTNLQTTKSSNQYNSFSGTCHLFSSLDNINVDCALHKPVEYMWNVTLYLHAAKPVKKNHFIMLQLRNISTWFTRKSTLSPLYSQTSLTVISLGPQVWYIKFFILCSHFCFIVPEAFELASLSKLSNIPLLYPVKDQFEMDEVNKSYWISTY